MKERDLRVLVVCSLITFYCVTTESWDIVLLVIWVNTLLVSHVLEWLLPPDGPGPGPPLVRLTTCFLEVDLYLCRGHGESGGQGLSGHGMETVWIF